jgi:hypothetical protein
MALSDIVQVTITRETASVARAGFGVPCILASFSTTHFGERARVYDDLDGLDADGFGPQHFVHKAATAILAQNPKVSQIVVGRRALFADRKVRLTPVASPPANTLYRVLVNDQHADFTTDASPTIAEITAGLTSAINALMPSAWAALTSYAVGDRRKNGGNIYRAIVAGTSAASGGPSGTRNDIVDGTVTWEYIGPTVTATDNATNVLVDQDTAGAPYVLEVERRQLLTQKDESTDPGIVTDLTNVRTALDGNDAWYTLVTDAHSEAEIAALAGNVETLRKLFLCSSADDEVLTAVTTDIASDLEAANYARTALFWHERTATFPEAAWGGKVLPLDPGSETWKFKTLAGIVASTLDPTNTTNLDNKNANHYQTVAGVDITAEGTTASGEFIDVTRFVDSLQADIEEHVFARLAASAKIPFTDAGIAIIENELRGSLLRGITSGGLAADPAPTVTVPRAADVDPLDKADRILRDVLFTAVLAGAIHKLVINGRLTV